MTSRKESRQCLLRFPATLLEMKRAWAVLLLVPLAGCGSFTYPPATGTWTFSLISSVTPSEPPQTLTGTLQTDGSSANATLVFSNACFKGQKISFSGTIDTTDALKLTSTTYNNQDIYFTGTLSSDGSFLTAGTYNVNPDDTTKPSCAGNDSGSVTGKRTATATTVREDAGDAAP